MARKLARIVQIDSISPIPKADKIVCARVGGWPVCIRPGDFAVGDKAVYFEIDSFLPQGNPAWQHLIEATSTEFEGVIGHRLRSVTLRGQLSQGFLMPLSALPEALRNAELGTDLTAALQVTKFVKPIPAELLEISNGYRPGFVPGTDLDRVQTLEADGALKTALAPVNGKPAVFQVTEKLEGEATHYANVDNQFNVYSSDLGFKDLPGVVRWELARKHRIQDLVASKGTDFVVQGELIGPGCEGNHYELKECAFYLYRALDVGTGTLLTPAQRMALAAEWGIPHVPVLHEGLALDQNTMAEQLQALADGPSIINPKKRREGVVLCNVVTGESIKVVSNAYLTNQKLPANAPLLNWPV